MSHAWHIAVLLLTACLFTGCSPSDEPAPGPRPGDDPQPPAMPATLRFVPASTEITTSGAPCDTRLTLSLVREGTNLPDTSYVLGADDRWNIISHLPAAVFRRGQTSVNLDIGIAASPGAGQTLQARILAYPAPGFAPAEASVSITGIDTWTAAGTALLVSGSLVRRLDMHRQTIAGRSHIRATDSEGEVLRQFIVEADGTLSIAGIHGLPAGYISATTAENADENMRRRFPVLALPSVGNRTEGWYGLNMVYTDQSGNNIPHYEIIVADNTPGWSEAFACTFVDGWLAPVVSFEARPPMVASENPWAVPMQRSTACPSRFRLIGIYRGGSPLSPLNSAAAPGIVSLTVGDGIVEIPPQEAGFASTTLFSAPFVIGGSGTVTADGNTATATVPLPMHNAYGAYGTTWAQPVPAVLRWNMK